MDDMQEFEDDLGLTDEVYGDHAELAESLNAFTEVAAMFGRPVVADLVTTINEAVPFLAEAEERRPTTPEAVEDFIADYFSTSEDEAKFYDAVAEAIKVAQRWLLAFMEAHTLPVISVGLPSVRGGMRQWTFGKLSDVKAHTDVDTQTIRLAATTKIERPVQDPQNPSDEGPEPGGYL